jgi:ribosomal protein L1
MQGNGPNYSVKVGKTSQEAKDVAENILAALPQSLGYVAVHDEIKFSKV